MALFHKFTLGFDGRLRRRDVTAVAVATVAVVLIASWWLGRPERRLAEAAEALARSDFERARALLPLAEATPRTRDRALAIRARSAIELGRFAEAARALDAINPSGPLAITVGLLRGRVLYQTGRIPLATVWFRWVIERSPGDLDAHRRLAAACYDQGDRPSAISALEHVTQIDPKDARAWRTLALLYKEDVDYERAEPAYEATLRLDPAQPSVRFERAETLLKLGRFNLAHAELSTCRGKVPEADRVVLESRCLHLGGEEAARREAIGRALADHPDHPGLLAQRAEIDVEDGKFTDALARLDRSIRADPFESERVYQRATVLRVLGRTEEAARDHARAAELNRGLATMERLNDQAARSPDDPHVRCRLGGLCVDLGKRDLAASWYRAALACDPNDTEARSGLSGLGVR